jgi:lipopolysaccharide biosynthesis glycosyltransferase
MNKINIAISASSTYIKYAKVMMASVYAAHPSNKINLFVFYIDDKVALSEAVLKRQSQLHDPGNSVNFIQVDRDSLKKIDNGKGWAIDLWCRWYILDVLAIKYDRVLLLGIDTFVRSNIGDFYFQDMTGYYFACAPDIFIGNTQPSAWPAIKMDMDRTGLGNKDKYINGDVVLVNLNETNGKLSFAEFLDLYYINQFTFWDQDVITYCFSSYIKYQDPYIYNYFPNLNLNSIVDEENLNRVKILHFAGGPKPWLVEPWLAKNFIGIPEWWDVAKKEGFLDIIEYIRYIKLYVKRYLHKALNRVRTSVSANR